MSMLGFIVGVVGLFVGLMANRRAKAARTECDRVLRSVSSMRVALLQELEDIRGSIPHRVHIEIKKANGELRFTPDMVIAEAIAIDSRVRDVMAQFHIGGCSSCAVSGEETLAEGARSHGVDPEALLAALNAMLEGRPIQIPKPAATPQPIGIGGIGNDLAPAQPAAIA